MLERVTRLASAAAFSSDEDGLDVSGVMRDETAMGSGLGWGGVTDCCCCVAGAAEASGDWFADDDDDDGVLAYVT